MKQAEGYNGKTRERNMVTHVCSVGTILAQVMVPQHIYDYIVSILGSNCIKFVVFQRSAAVNDCFILREYFGIDIYLMIK